MSTAAQAYYLPPAQSTRTLGGLGPHVAPPVLTNSPQPAAPYTSRYSFDPSLYTNMGGAMPSFGALGPVSGVGQQSSSNVIGKIITLLHVLQQQLGGNPLVGGPTTVFLEQRNALSQTVPQSILLRQLPSDIATSIAYHTVHSHTFPAASVGSAASTAAFLELSAQTSNLIQDDYSTVTMSVPGNPPEGTTFIHPTYVSHLTVPAVVSQRDTSDKQPCCCCSVATSCCHRLSPLMNPFGPFPIGIPPNRPASGVPLQSVSVPLPPAHVIQTQPLTAAGLSYDTMLGNVFSTNGQLVPLPAMKSTGIQQFNPSITVVPLPQGHQLPWGSSGSLAVPLLQMQGSRNVPKFPMAGTLPPPTALSIWRPSVTPILPQTLQGSQIRQAQLLQQLQAQLQYFQGLKSSFDASMAPFPTTMQPMVRPAIYPGSIFAGRYAYPAHSWWIATAPNSRESTVSKQIAIEATVSSPSTHNLPTESEKAASMLATLQKKRAMKKMHLKHKLQRARKEMKALRSAAEDVEAENEK